MQNFEVFGNGVDGLVNICNQMIPFSQYASSTSVIQILYPPNTTAVDNSVEDSNFAVKILEFKGTYNDGYYNEGRLTLNEGYRVCYVQYDEIVKLNNQPDTGIRIKNIFPVFKGQSYNINDIFSEIVFGASTQQNNKSIRSDNVGRKIYSGSEYTLTNFLQYGIPTWRYNSPTSTQRETYFGYLLPLNINELLEKMAIVHIGVGDDFGIMTPTSSPKEYNGLSVIYGNINYPLSFSYDKLPFPVFDINDTDGIIKYLNTGIDTSSIDPFNITNPDIESITDWNTDFDMWISKYKVSITSSNRQYYENRSSLTGIYELSVSANGIEYPSSKSQIPTVTINPMSKVSQSVTMVFRGDIQQFESSGYFRVNLLFNDKKQSGYTINSVEWGEYGEYSEYIDRSIIGENYVYTASSGEKLTIHFSEITLDDLKDLVDDGYINREDENDDESGSDILGQFGSGYGTYKINDGAFEDINTAMWSTDWSTLFKPSTTSPTQCIISCKRIPFTIGGTSVGEIPLANLSVKISGSAAKVNQVKSFTLPNLQIPAIYGNFVDQYMAKVRVYLPYIGWAELPADAVISKVGRASVGLQSETRILGFKYIIDFVDGNCKCVISVNGTERWMFEGNCGCDVPITSDNHSAALTRSAKGLMASAMTVAAGVITTASGNVMMGVGEIAGGVLSALNSVPNYSYTASANISGLIEASSNHHLMVVVEYPNAWYPNGTAHKVGLPCELYLNLAQCSGFTKCADVDVSGIDCTSDEADMIRSLLTEGVYL